MPIDLNFQTGDFMNKPIYGKNEITEMAFEQKGCKRIQRKKSFYTAMLGSNAISFDFILKTHDWLGDNMQGPWHLKIGDCNMGHSLDCKIHIERFDQRDIFQTSEYGKYFSRNDFKDDYFIKNRPEVLREWKQREMVDLGIIKGVIPPFTTQDSMDLWIEEQNGIEDGMVGSIDDPHFMRFANPVTEIEKSFQKNFVTTGIYVPDEKFGYIRYNGYYSGNDKLQQWKDNNLAVSVTFRKKGEDYEHAILFRDADIEEKFKQNWGGKFAYDPENKLYLVENETWRELPERHVPPELIEYLDGGAPDPSQKLLP